jgi:hypothetical protein
VHAPHGDPNPVKPRCLAGVCNLFPAPLQACQPAKPRSKKIPSQVSSKFRLVNIFDLQFSRFLPIQRPAVNSPSILPVDGPTLPTRPSESSFVLDRPFFSPFPLESQPVSNMGYLDDEVKRLQGIISTLEGRVKSLEERQTGGSPKKTTEEIRMLLIGPPGAGRILPSPFSQ